MDQLLEGGMTQPISLADLSLRLALAAGLGVLLAWRPLSRLAGSPGSRPEIAYGTLLMTVASALVIVVIGDSLARAFGVVGLGSFVRFRTAIKDASDVVLFFVAIGVGMACGLGAFHYAVVGAVALSLILVPRDLAVLRRPPGPGGPAAGGAEPPREPARIPGPKTEEEVLS